MSNLKAAFLLFCITVFYSSCNKQEAVNDSDDVVVRIKGDSLILEFSNGIRKTLPINTIQNRSHPLLAPYKFELKDIAFENVEEAKGIHFVPWRYTFTVSLSKNFVPTYVFDREEVVPFIDFKKNSMHYVSLNERRADIRNKLNRKNLSKYQVEELQKFLDILEQ